MSTIEEGYVSHTVKYNIIGICIGTVVGTLLSLIVMGCCIGFIMTYRSQQDVSYKSIVLNEIEASMSNTRYKLATSISVVETIAEVIASNDYSITEQQFLNMTSRLRTKHGTIIQYYEYATGDGMALTLIDPVTSPMFGLKLLEYSAKHASKVLLAINNNTITIYGPFKLLQGGTAISVMYPIWYNNGTINGISTVIISLDELFKNIILPNEFSYVMSSASGGIFFTSNNTIVNSTSYLSTSFDLYSELWTIYVYSNNWYNDPYIWLETIVIMILMVFTIMLNVLLIRSIAIGCLSKKQAEFYKIEFELELRNRMKDLLNYNTNTVIPPNIIILYIQNGTILSIQGDVMKYLLYKPEDLIGKHITSIIKDVRYITDMNGHRKRCVYSATEDRCVISIDDSSTDASSSCTH